MMIDLNSDIEILKGIGPKKKSTLNSIGIHSIQDLIYYFPRRYLDRNFTNSIILKQGEIVTLLATVKDSYLAHGKKSRLIVGLETNRKERISILFFKGIPYFKSVFKQGMNLVVTGKLEYFRGFQIIHPDFEILSSQDDPEDMDLIHSGRIIPLYPSNETLKSEGLDSRGFRRLIKQLIDLLDDNKLAIPEILPKQSIKLRKLFDRKNSFKEIHFPTSDESLSKAKYRFAYEELYFFNLLMLYKRKKREEAKRILWPLKESPSAKKVIGSLPYQLTQDQINAIDSIKSFNKKDLPTAILLQGDVGSGKTITALLVALHYTDNDIQVAMVAPTEILARQHFSTIQNILNYSPFQGIELLLGKEKEKIKKEKIERLKNGEISFLIGTHSVFQDDVQFKDLGLVIIDEQHKFGVEQRESLRKKGKNPDILAMTATPIPRSLCLTLYGDLNLITIKSKPSGRLPITTKWFFEDKREAVYKSIIKYLLQNRQCYVVYPLIEESENSDLKSCIEGFEYLKNAVFKDFKVGLLHGKMKTAEKDSVMNSFKTNETKILVTTTVVEVGIDVPNATVLVIENADRFGISQLHQLRGRVGRSNIESFCILMTKDKVSEDGKVRLEAMTLSNDGFELAEKDLKLRGPGELLGLRQSGLPDFKIADLQNDLELVSISKEDAEKFGVLSDLEKIEIRFRFNEGRIIFPN